MAVVAVGTEARPGPARWWASLPGPGQDLAVAAGTAVPAVGYAGLSDAPWPAYALGVACSAGLVGHRRRPWAAQALGYGALVAAPFLGVDVEVLVGTFAVLVFGGFFTAFAVALGVLVRRHRSDAAELARRNAELERLREAEAHRAVMAERTRIAREIHDVVAHHVSGVVVRAQAALHVHPSRPDEAVDALRYVAAVGGETLGALRGVLGLLRDAPGTAELGPQPDLGDLPTLVVAAAAAGQAVSAETAGELSTVPAAAQIVAFRVTQEALTNARKHATGAPVSVRVTRTDTELAVTVVNPVTGRTVAAPGHGLTGMRERAEAVGGRLSVGCRDDEWRVHLVIPTARARP